MQQSESTTADATRNEQIKKIDPNTAKHFDVSGDNIVSKENNTDHEGSEFQQTEHRLLVALETQQASALRGTSHASSERIPGLVLAQTIHSVQCRHGHLER